MPQTRWSMEYTAKAIKYSKNCDTEEIQHQLMSRNRRRTKVQVIEEHAAD
jgi:hypothetical protein